MLQEKRVVTCFLESEGEILILYRSEQVGSYQGRWAGVSGYVETTADKQGRLPPNHYNAILWHTIKS